MNKDFFAWLEGAPGMTSSAIALWFALRDTWEKAGKPENLTVAFSTLEGKTRLRPSTLKDARKALVKSGRIEYIPSGKRKASVYRLLPLTNSERRLNSGLVEGIDSAGFSSVDSDKNCLSRQAAVPLVIVDSNNNNNNNNLNNNGAESKVFAHYCLSIGGYMSNSAKAEILNFLKAGITAELIMRAIDVSVDSGVRSWMYARGVLNKCLAGGRLTVKAFEDFQAERVKVNKPSDVKRSKYASYTQRDTDYSQYEKMERALLERKMKNA